MAQDSKTTVKHRPTKPPVERQHPYMKGDRNHIFVAMDYNPLSDEQMAMLEDMIHKKYEEWFPAGKGADPKLVFHTWVRVFP